MGVKERKKGRTCGMECMSCRMMDTEGVLHGKMKQGRVKDFSYTVSINR